MMSKVEAKKENYRESVKFLNEIEATGKSLYLDENLRRNSFSASSSNPNPRSKSIKKSQSLGPIRRLNDSNEDLLRDSDKEKSANAKLVEGSSTSFGQTTPLRKLLPKDSKIPQDPSRKEKKSSFWNWKPLRALSGDKNRRFRCRFQLQVHSIEGLPLGFKERSLCVHWKRRDEDRVTRPVKVIDKSVEFDETLLLCCSARGTKSGPHGSVKYEAKYCLIHASVVGESDLDLGRHRVDLTRLLPLTLEELEDDKRSGKWTTSFKLSGKAKGATMNVSFGYTVLSDTKQNRKTSFKVGNDDRVGTIRHVESLPCLDRIDLPDVLPSSKSDTDYTYMADEKFDEYTDDASTASKPEPDASRCPSSVASESNEYIEKESEGNHSGEVSTVSAVSNVESHRSDEINPDTSVNSEETSEFVVQDCDSKVDEQFSKESLMRDLELALEGITNLEAALDSPDLEDSEDEDKEDKANHETNTISKSHSMDELTDSVASELFSMLGIDQSPLSLSSDSESESPRERLLRQFEKETLASGCSLFDFDMADGEELECGFDISTSGNLTEGADTPYVVRDAAIIHEWGLNEKA